MALLKLVCVVLKLRVALAECISTIVERAGVMEAPEAASAEASIDAVVRKPTAAKAGAGEAATVKAAEAASMEAPTKPTPAKPPTAKGGGIIDM